MQIQGALSGNNRILYACLAHRRGADAEWLSSSARLSQEWHNTNQSPEIEALCWRMGSAGSPPRIPLHSHFFRPKNRVPIMAKAACGDKSKPFFGVAIVLSAASAQQGITHSFTRTFFN